MDLMDINVEAFRTINDFGKQYTYLNTTVVFIAEYMVYVLALVTLIYWFTRKDQNRMMVVCGTITFLIAEVLGKIAGLFYSNNQPFAELANVNKLIEKAVDNSFPSDHTILFFSFCVTFWFFQKRLGFLWVILACGVGLSRIWVGVHYPGDVVVAAIISITSSIIVYNVVPKLAITKKLIGIYEKGESLILPAKSKAKEL